MTTKRFITAAVLTATLLASQFTMLRAESGESGLPWCCCAYSLWTCTYNDGSYWDRCDPTFPSGQLWTIMAATRCETWHAAP